MGPGVTGLRGPAKLESSFIKRMNLRIRQGLAYLFRRRICQARWKERLEAHLEVLRCHRALKFRREVRTPAMQAGLTRKRLTFRETFSTTAHFWALRNVTFVFFDSALLVDVGDWCLSVAA